MTFTRALPFQSTFPRGERRTARGRCLPLWKFQSTFPRGERLLLSILLHDPLLFQSTFPRGERLRSTATVWICSHNFNPRSLVGNDYCIRPYLPGFFHFNPRSLVGNDVHPLHYQVRHKLFQSTFPRGERRFWVGPGPEPDNFNPRSLVGNDDAVVHVADRDAISIHVPSWGTTALGRIVAIRTEISIHVPSWGTTSYEWRTVLRDKYFNPRSLVGNDDGDKYKDMIAANFNPRSLVGNDCRRCDNYLGSGNFNPRSLVGND